MKTFRRIMCAGKGRRDSGVLSNESGQAITEYILLLFTVFGAYLIVAAFLTRFKLQDRLMAPIKEDFVYAYKYGNPKTRGYDEGEPKNHPRVFGGDGTNFRIFINPSVR
jgi:hypothetical protein